MEHSSKPTLVLEINPQYLVPDTNCFIDHLPGLQYIVESRYFTVVIPLVGKQSWLDDYQVLCKKDFSLTSRPIKCFSNKWTGRFGQRIFSHGHWSTTTSVLRCKSSKVVFNVLSNVYFGPCLELYYHKNHAVLVNRVKTTLNAIPFFNVFPSGLQ